jgi:hypothetical protein
MPRLLPVGVDVVCGHLREQEVCVASALNCFWILELASYLKGVCRMTAGKQANLTAASSIQLGAVLWWALTHTRTCAIALLGVFV